MDNALINTAATHETRNEPQEGVPEPSASPVLDGSCAPSTSTNPACRLVHIALALYLIPAFLIVLLVGAVGMLVVGMVRLFTRLPGSGDTIPNSGVRGSGREQRGSGAV
jgi:hypothetical protein